MTAVTAAPPGAPAVALAIGDVVKRFGAEHALRGVSLDLRDGECVTLLGPSGSGKSTLLKVIAGFERATSGSVAFQGREIGGLSPAERGAGMVFQNYALFPHMTVEANVAYGLKLRRWPAARRAERVREMLALVGLEGFGARHPRQLSGGQQQRVAIARALAYDPPLLLMDEPLGALDRTLRLEMVEQIRRIHRELETTIVYVTHDQQEALALSDRIAIMRDGRIVDVGTPERLFRRPRTEFVARFFGDANVFDATLGARADDGTVAVACGGQRLTGVAAQADADGAGGGEGAAVRLAVRPRRLRRDGRPGGLRVAGPVLETLLLGDERELVVDGAALGLGRVRAVLPAHESDDVAVGAQIELVAAVGDLVLVAADGRENGDAMKDGRVG